MTHTVNYRYNEAELHVTFTEPMTGTEACFIALAEAKRHAVPAIFEIGGVTPPDNLPLIAHPFDSVDDVLRRITHGRGNTLNDNARAADSMNIGGREPCRFFKRIIDGTVALELTGVHAGEHINTVIQSMLALAKTASDVQPLPVFYTFNGIMVVVERGGTQTPEEVLARWSDAMNLSGEAYRRTPEAIAAKLEQKTRDRADENAIAGLYTQLPAILDAIPDLPGLLDKVRDPAAGYFGGSARIVRERLNAVRALMGWFMEYAPKADNIGIDTKKAQVVDLFETRGFRDGDGLGRDKNAYADPALLAVNIIGQSIGAHKKHGMPPHPVVAHWAEKSIDVIDTLLRGEHVPGLADYEARLNTQ